MTKLIVATIKAAISYVILATLILALFIQHQAASFDPVAAIHQLKNPEIPAFG